ncbi:MAG: hypothetical protein JNJ46_27575 [Myxococcales bacterium]|nr:hypothetical protein [Myxococcales bacterium]
MAGSVVEDAALRLIDDAQRAFRLRAQIGGQQKGFGVVYSVEKIGSEQRGFDVALGVLQQIEIERCTLFFVELFGAQSGGATTDAAMVTGNRHGHERLRATQQANQNADGIAEERGIQWGSHRRGHRGGIGAHGVSRFDPDGDGVLDDNAMQRLQRFGANTADVFLQARVFGGGISDAQQTERAVGGRVGEVKFELLEVDLEDQIEHEGAQDLLRGKPLATDISPNRTRRQIVEDLRFQLRQAVEDLGNAMELQRVFVGNPTDGKRGLNAMCRAHEVTFPSKCARQRKTDQRPQP